MNLILQAQHFLLDPLHVLIKWQQISNRPKIPHIFIHIQGLWRLDIDENLGFKHIILIINPPIAQ
jgi:hypothetical protein